MIVGPRYNDVDPAVAAAARVLHETESWVRVTDLDDFVDSLMAELFGPEWDQESP